LISGATQSSLAHYLITMPETDADNFRIQADMCHARAAKTVSQPDKDAWLRLAADWLMLAEDAERRMGEKGASSPTRPSGSADDR
jgi:hypothetical protein